MKNLLKRLPWPIYRRLIWLYILLFEGDPRRFNILPPFKKPVDPYRKSFRNRFTARLNKLIKFISFRK
jgi:hypothetical protein